MNELKNNDKMGEKLRLMVHPAADILTTEQVKDMVRTKIGRDVLVMRILRMRRVPEERIQEIRQSDTYILFEAFLIYALALELKKSGR